MINVCLNYESEAKDVFVALTKQEKVIEKGA